MKYNKIFPKIFIAVLYFYLSIFFTSKADNVALADSAYHAEDYAKAIELFTKVSKDQGVSSALYFDLGNAYARIGDYGNAMVCYLRSLRLDPSNMQAKDNISYIDSKVMESNLSELRGKKYSLEPDTNSFFTSVKFFIARDHLSNTWSVWAAVCFILFISCLAIYIFTKNVLARKIGFFGGFILLGMSVISIIFSFMAASYSSDEGVVTTAKVKLKSEASDSSKDAPIYLTRGTRMNIIDKYPAGENKPKWYKVRLNSDFIGWIQDGDFTPVDIF